MYRQLTGNHNWINVTALAPGLLVAALVAGVAMGIDHFERGLFGQPIIEGLVAAIIVGMLVRNVVRMPAVVGVGAGFAAKEVLEFAVLLLGASVDARQVFAAGPLLLGVIATGVIGSILFSYVFGRAVGLSGNLALLVAVGNSICGNSAIAALAPVIKSNKRDIASSIALTAVIGVGLVLSLPLLMPLANLSFYEYGVVAGMTVYAVPQVIAASFPVSEISGEVATLVKLLRVLFLGPVVLAFGLLMRARGARAGTAQGQRPALVPWFIVGFLVLAALRFIGIIPAAGITVAQESSRILTVVAMAGLGLAVDLAMLRQAGPRVAVAALGSLIFLLLLSLTLILTLGVAG
ncbi:MAG: YeiH family protein [Chloroflexota bacterium]